MSFAPPARTALPACVAVCLAVAAWPEDAAAQTFSVSIEDGMVVAARDGRLSVRRGNVRAPIAVTAGVTPQSAAVDRVARRLTVTVQENCDGLESRLHFTFDQIEARVVNASALAEHRQKRFAAAAAGFARAAALDPDFDLAATNLASALTSLGRRAEAMRALAPLIARRPIDLYARVALDPELAPLIAEPALAALRARTRGDARLAPTGEVAGGVAWSPRHHLVATSRTEASWGSCQFDTWLEIFDTRSGARAAALHLVRWPETSDDCDAGLLVRRSARKAVADRIAIASRVLVDLGFAAGKAEAARDPEETADGKHRTRFARSGLGLVMRGGAIRVVRRDHVLAEGRGLHRMDRAYHVPGARVVVVATGRPGREGCESTDPTATSVLPLRSN
jgi:tetratricopeptide (TPR) repeat protein